MKTGTPQVSISPVDTDSPESVDQRIAVAVGLAYARALEYTDSAVREAIVKLRAEILTIQNEETKK